MTNDVFIYWDNSNIFYAAQWLANEREQVSDASYRIRISLPKLYRLAHADRPVTGSIVAGMVQPGEKPLQDKFRELCRKVVLIEQADSSQGEQEVPDLILQFEMMRDWMERRRTPATAVLLTGDGAGYSTGVGFHKMLELLHEYHWKVEVLSWNHTCNNHMREWVKQNGVFVALDDFYEAITYLKASGEGHPHAPARHTTRLDLSQRMLSAK